MELAPKIVRLVKLAFARQREMEAKKAAELPEKIPASERG